MCNFELHSHYTQILLALVNQTKPHAQTKTKTKKSTFESSCQGLYFAAPESFDPVFVYVYMINVLKWA